MPEEIYKRAPCDKLEDSRPCANSKCDKLHFILRNKEYQEFIKDHTVCMYGERCDYKPCELFHLHRIVQH